MQIFGDRINFHPHLHFVMTEGGADRRLATRGDLRQGRSRTGILALGVNVPARRNGYGLERKNPPWRSRQDAWNIPENSLPEPQEAAAVLSWPIAYFAAGKWLAGFAYRIDLDLWQFAAASLLVFLVAGLTMSRHILRAARAAPARSLRCSIQ